MTVKREKKDMKKYLITMAIGLVPGIAFAWIVGKLLDLSVWKAWLWIQGIILLSDGIIGTIEYVVFRLIWRNDMVDNISESLSAHEYPNLKKYPHNTLAEDYFGSVIQDDEIEIGTRLDAAYTLGTIASQLGFFRSMRINSAMSNAIDKYHRIKFGGRDYSEPVGEYE
jgi:hypothetical protein